MSQMMPTEDRVLVKNTLLGDTQAFECLVERYKHMVFTLAVRMLRNREEAEESAQDTFLKVYKRLESYRGGARFSTWLYKIAYHNCLDQLKKRKSRPETTDLDGQRNISQGYEAGILDDMERDHRRHHIQIAIESLPEQDAAIITMYYFEEWSIKEISEVTELSPQVVKVRLYRSRKQLASSLRPILEAEKQ